MRFHLQIIQLPEAERKDAAKMLSFMCDLERFIVAFNYARELRDTCKSDSEAIFDQASNLSPPERVAFSRANTPALNKLSAWQRMAEKDGAFQVYHFAETIKNIQAMRNRLRITATYIDKEIFNRAEKIFISLFPHRREARNAAGHQAEAISQPEKHAFTGKYESSDIKIDGVGSVTLIDALTDDGLLNTFNKDIRQIAMTKENADKLEMVVQMYADSIVPIREALKLLSFPLGETLQPAK